jgi:MFS family permease
VGLGTVIGATYTAKRNELMSRIDNGDSQAKRGTGFISRLDQKGFFLLGLLGSATFAALQGVWVAIVPLALFRLLFGAFNGILTVSGNVLAATAVTREFRGRAFGVMNGILPMGAVVGPLLGGAAGDSLGLGSAFFVSSAVFLLSAGVLRAFISPRRRPVLAQDSGGVSSPPPSGTH